MKKVGYFIATSLLIGMPVAAAAQHPTWDDIESKRAAEEAEMKRQMEMRRRMEDRRDQMEKGVKPGAKPEAAPVKVWLESQLPGRERRLLAPAPEVRQKYEAFLRGPDTGLFKIIALGGPTVSVSGTQSGGVFVPIRGGGSFYSFSKHRHDADEWAQLRLFRGQLQSGRTLQEKLVPFGERMTTVRFTPDGLTAFVSLGDVPLENVGLQTSGVGFLSSLTPPTEFAELEELTRRLAAGVKDGPFSYVSSLPVNPDATFALRSVLYKQADLLIAFRVVRQDDDGSLHILWKQLKSYSPPSLKGKPQRKS